MTPKSLRVVQKDDLTVGKVYTVNFRANSSGRISDYDYRGEARLHAKEPPEYAADVCHFKCQDGVDGYFPISCVTGLVGDNFTREMFVAGNRYSEPTVHCEICGDATPMTGTKRCDRCWELERRIMADPDLAEKIIHRSKPRCTEQELTTAGWYFFTPRFPEAAMNHNPHFVELSQVTIDDKDLVCRRYAGTYVGPYQTPQ
jgi:hypothetical protein